MRVERATLEELYEKLNRREFVHPDPLEFLYRYEDPADREVVGLLSSSLAYGRVRQILASVGEVLDRMGSHPAEFVRASTPGSLREVLAGFKHRFTTGEDLCGMLDGVRDVITEHGSLGSFFAGLVDDRDRNVVPALTTFVRAITESRRADDSCALGVGSETTISDGGGGSCPLPDPARGSACKRLHLFLRWMVRKDDVDPGGWDTISPSKLLVPLDTHMHRLSLMMGLTERKAADYRTAVEVTDAFRQFSPEDPVRYDFALTRLGIRSDMSENALLLQSAVEGAK